MLLEMVRLITERCNQDEKKQLLATVVAVSGPFATATEIPILAVKNAGIRHNEALYSQLQLKRRGLR